jgi:hypothetical protein
MSTIIYNPDGTETFIPGAPVNPDRISDNNNDVMRRLLILALKRTGLTDAQIIAAFSASKRQTD